MTSRRALIGAGAGVAVLAALGYRTWDRGVFSSGKGEAFEPWQEWQGQAGEGARRPLHAAILAANAHNSQPWLFEPHEDSINVYADLSRNLGSFDPFRREMYLSLGCAIANLQLAAYRYGLLSKIQAVQGRLGASPSDRPVKVAQIDLLEARNNDIVHDDIFQAADAIPHRHTNRGPYYADRAVAPEILKLISGGYPGARVVLARDAGARKELGDIIVEATQHIIADKQMAADSARWFRTGRREILEHRDGVTTDAAGLSPALAAATKLLPDLGTEQSDKYWLSLTRETQVPTASIFGMVLVRDRLDMAQALYAGYAWQMLHLTATVHGVAAQPLNQPMEMIDRNAVLGRPDTFAPALKKIAGGTDWEPTFAFRLGYAEREALPSPRHSLDQVIRSSGFA